MTQRQAQVPDPLGDDLPTFLPKGSMRTPAVGVLLLVFVSKNWFKGPAMQVEGQHIRSQESALWQIRQEQLVDDVGAGEAHATPFLGGGMRRHHDPNQLSLRTQRQLRTIVEAAADPALRMSHLLVWGQMQASLDLSSIQKLIVFASRHIAEASEIGEDGSGALLPIQPEQGTFLRELARREIPPDGRHRPAQFLPKFSIASVCK